MTDQRGYDLETLSAAKTYSNINCGNRQVDYGITTDGGNATMMQKDGVRLDVVPNTSYEYVGSTCKDNQPGKVIIAKNGNIQLEAQNGDIILKAKNIRIVAEDGSGEITLNSGKIIEFKAPALNENATNVRIAASGNVDILGNTISSSAQISNDASSSVDAIQGSFLGKAFSGLKGLKKFFKDCLGIG